MAIFSSRALRLQLLAGSATLALMGCANSTDNSTTASTSAHQLLGQHWTLQQVYASDGSLDRPWVAPAQGQQPERQVQLDFIDGQRLSVQRLCNQMHGQYQIDGQRITIQRMVSTMMACQNEQLTQLERKVGQTLPLAQSWRIESGTQPLLQLQFSDGSRWVLQGSPTHASLYGEPTRIFLEVAPRKVACVHGAMGPTQCMQVREVRYNAQGIRSFTGAWEPFYDGIEGYTHQEGMRNVLRINRYEPKQMPADAGRYIYVLDMAVETEVQR